EDPRDRPGTQDHPAGVAGPGAGGVLLHRGGPGNPRRPLLGSGPGTGLRLPAQAVPRRQGQAPGAAARPADPAGPASRRIVPRPAQRITPQATRAPPPPRGLGWSAWLSPPACTIR